MRLLVVINPISGDKDKSNFTKFVHEKCYSYAIKLRLYLTMGDDAQDQEAIRKEGEDFAPDRIVAVGGDGTLAMAIKIFKGQNIPIGFVPYGSANGMALELNTSQNPEQAFVDCITTHLTLPMDIVRINGNDSIHVADVGLNAEVVAGYDQDPNRGMMTYAKYFVKALKENEILDYRITADGETYEVSGYMLAIANGTRYGTGMYFNPAGNMADGKFEVIVYSDINLAELMRAGLSGIFPELEEKEKNFTVSCRKAVVEVEKPRKLQVDGEALKEVSTIEAEIMEHAVPILITKHHE